MVDFFKNILAGATILIQSLGYVVGINPDLPNFNYPSPSPVIISSPTPSSYPNPSPEVNSNQINNANNNQKNNQQTNTTPIVTHDGTRTGNIIKYKEWCKGNQEISIYENELITKKSSDGKTYSMTVGDWDCYEKSLTVKAQGQRKVNCQLYGDQWVLMESRDQCTKVQSEFIKRKQQEGDTFLKQLPPLNNPSTKNDPASEDLYAQELERKKAQLDQDCRQEKTWIDEEKNRKIDSENSSLQGSLESVRSRYAGIGMGSSGDRYAAEGVAIVSHQRRLENIENLYNQKLSELRAKGCNF